MVSSPDCEIEKYIAPLVEILNQNGVKTRFSCHGHLRSPSAWVIFSCRDVEVARSMWFKLQGTYNRFFYLWTVKPWFTRYNGEFGFILEGTPRGLRPSRKSLLRDTDTLKDLLFGDGDISRGVSEHHNKEQSADERVFRVTLGIPTDNEISTVMTFSELCQEIVHYIASRDSIKRRLFARSNRQKILISCPIKQTDYMYELSEMLRSLHFEGAFKSWPEIEGYFVINGVLLKINLRQ